MYSDARCSALVRAKNAVDRVLRHTYRMSLFPTGGTVIYLCRVQPFPKLGVCSHRAMCHSISSCDLVLDAAKYRNAVMVTLRTYAGIL